MELLPSMLAYLRRRDAQNNLKAKYDLLEMKYKQLFVVNQVMGWVMMCMLAMTTRDAFGH